MSKSLIIGLVITLAITIPTIFYQYKHKNGMSQQQLSKWTIEGHAQQFCTIIFPNLASCLTIKQEECKPVATEAITACVNDLASSMKKYYSKPEAKEFYQKIGDCFQHNLHDTLMQNYVVASEECWAKMQ